MKDRFVSASYFLILAFAFVASTCLAADNVIKPDDGKKEDNQIWYDVRLVGLEGQGFTKTKAPFDRLPAEAEGVVRDPVWGLSRNSAGLCVRFATNSREIRCRWKLTSSRLALPHMPATGVSGVDLYVKHDGRWRWLACGRPTSQENMVALASGMPPGDREFLLYFPLYNGVTSVELGLPAATQLRKPPPRKHAKPLVFYGTSITQGGCASRPGMVHTAILGRWLDRPVINLGFSGNGRMEQEVVQFMNEIDAEVFIIDCLPNLTAPDVAARAEPLVRAIRQKHPRTPILLVEDRNYTDSHLIASKRERNETNQAALRRVFERLSPSDDNLYYLAGADLLGDDFEGTVDSSHPTDLGFYRQAESFRDCLMPILKRLEEAE